MDWIAFLKSFMEWFPDRNKVLFALCLLSGLLLFLPWNQLTAMHLEKFADMYRVEEWLIFLFCSLILLAEGIHGAWKRLHVHEEIDARLRQLTTPELGVITRIMAGEQMLKWTHEDGVEGLHQNGILWREPGPYDNGHYVYGLTKSARARVIALRIAKPK